MDSNVLVLPAGKINGSFQGAAVLTLNRDVFKKLYALVHLHTQFATQVDAMGLKSLHSAFSGIEPAAWIPDSAFPPQMRTTLWELFDGEMSLLWTSDRVPEIPPSRPGFAPGRVKHGAVFQVDLHLNERGVWWTALASDGFDSANDLSIHTSVVPRDFLEAYLVDAPTEELIDSLDFR